MRGHGGSQPDDFADLFLLNAIYPIDVDFSVLFHEACSIPA